MADLESNSNRDVDEQGFVSVSTTAESSSTNSVVGAPSASSISTEQGVASQVVDMFQRSSHPKVALFHVIFKVAALCLYMLNGMFIGMSHVQLFVVCIVMMAFDFWTVKNVSGRLMVGLRWWNESDENGQSTWRYESIEDQSTVSKIDYSLFWYPMYLAGVLWGVLSVVALFKFNLEATLLCTVCLVLVWSNVYAYWNCSSHARNHMKSAMMQGVQQGAMAAIAGKWFGGKSTDVV